jgi:GNAT superfamily N-acetyltransferase
LLQLLDNIFWHAFSGSQAKFAEGTSTARRFARGFSPIIAFADPGAPDFDALVPYCDIDERFYCDGWSGPAPAGWRIEVEASMYKMVWAGGAAPLEQLAGAVRLGPQHAQQALDLALLTRPGPFGPRTLELGEYYGCFEDGRLIAMAGERLQAGLLRELSGICTHPDAQGRGLARGLTALLLRLQLARGQTPFLHVMQANTTAHDFYLRLGFRDHALSPVRVLGRVGADTA